MLYPSQAQMINAHKATRAPQTESNQGMVGKEKKPKI